MVPPTPLAVKGVVVPAVGVLVGADYSARELGAVQEQALAQGNARRGLVLAQRGPTCRGCCGSLQEQSGTARLSVLKLLEGMHVPAGAGEQMCL